MFKQINGLESLRYAVTEPYNVVSFRDFARPSLVTFQITMATTYQQLIEHHLSKLQKTTKPEAYTQVSKNHLTALRAFLRYHQKNETTSIGSELGDDFEAAVKAHLVGSDLSERTRADRRSLLNSWRATFVEQGLACEPLSRIKAQRRVTDAGLTPFESTLKDAIKKAQTTPKTAAKRAGVSVSAMQRWTNGAVPNIRTVDSLNRLDAVLNLETGTLARAFAETVNKSGSQAPNLTPYRQRQRKHSQAPYQVKLHQLTPQFMREWRDFFDHKTATHTGDLARSAAGQWSLTAAQASAIQPNPINSKGNAVCASAGVVWERLSSFLGFLRLPLERGGHGIEHEQAQALAWLAAPEAIDAYMRFMADRADGICHTGHSVFATFIISLTNPQTGYLTQCPQLFDRLPSAVMSGRTPADLCRLANEMAKAWKKRSSGHSRNPLDAIRSLVELDEPLSPILQAMGRLRRIGNAAASGSKTELLARRDELILGLLIACPLRSKNIETLHYCSSNADGIYRTAAGQWRIRIALANLKNGESKRKLRTYDVPVAGWLNSRLDDYVNTVRPLLVKGTDPGYLLLTEDGKRLRSFAKLVAKLTRRYIPGCIGFGPHAFRHIVATDWLKKHPNDFLTVAELLGDTVETVIREYAHLKQDVAFSRHENHVSKLL